MNTQSKRLQRLKILNQANKLIKKKGFINLSLVELASSLKINRENIYYYFKNKEILGLNCLDLLNNNLQDFFLKLESSNLLADQKIQKYLDFYFKNHTKKATCSLVTLLNEYDNLTKNLQTKVNTICNLELSFIESFLEQGKQEQIFFFKEPPKEKAKKLVSFLKGTCLYQKISDDFLEVASETIIALKKN